MDREAQRQLGLAMCEKKRTRKEYVALKRRVLLAERRKSSPKPVQNSDSGDATPAAQRFPGTPRKIAPENERRAGFAAELFRLALLPANRRRFSVVMIMMALSIYLLSTSSYEVLRNFLPFPSRQTLSARMNGLMNFNITLLQNVSYIHAVCADVRERFETGDAVIAGILAVDAISFQRELIISKDGIVQGSFANETVSAEKLAKIHASYSEFENYWKESEKTLISDAFVFQFQPLNASIKSFVVHLYPSTQGKATEHTIQLLETIRSELTSAKFSVVGYAMDGDTTYSRLHKSFHSEYSSSVRYNATFQDFSVISKELLVVSDPLHILKRARYRLLASDVHLGLTNSSKVINVSVLREILPLPSKTFSNQPFTKMHDDLATSLFSLSSLVELYRKEPDYMAYFLPFCLLDAAISEEGLSVEERVNFLELSLYYMLAYVEEVTTSPKKLPDRKGPHGKAVRLFSANLALEHCNTVTSLLVVLHTFNGTLNLNRIGTNPLEHTFGAIRMRSRYKKTYDSMVRSLGASETYKRLLSFLGVGSRIAGRKTYYGQSISVALRAHTNVLPMDARDIAIAYHILFSLPISTEELESWNLNYVASNAEDIVRSNSEAISAIYRRLYPQEKNVRLNSRSILVSSGGSRCMVKRERELNPF